MADISALFGTLLALGIAFPGMLLAWWLLFPATVGRAHLRLEQTPWRCLMLGGVVAALAMLPILFLSSRPAGPVKFLALCLLASVLLVASLGAAGLAAKMGERLLARSPGTFSPLGAFVRGAIALELAAAFPFLGWFIALPLLFVTSLGASAFALLHWAPRVALPAPGEATSLRGVTDATPAP